MSRSLWSIFVLGAMTALLLTIAMLFTLDQYKASPAGNRFIFAESIRKEYRFDSAGADVGPIDGKMVLRISYMTTQDSKHDLAVRTKEMQTVADFAAAKYDGKDRGTIQEIRVLRTELRGSGCFQRTYSNAHSAPPPFEWKTGVRPALPPFVRPPDEAPRKP